MAPGTVAADWRHRRLAVRAVLSVRLPFLDVEAPWTATFLSKELAQELVAQVDDLDVAATDSATLPSPTRADRARVPLAGIVTVSSRKASQPGERVPLF